MTAATDPPEPMDEGWPGPVPAADPRDALEAFRSLLWLADRGLDAEDRKSFAVIVPDDAPPELVEADDDEELAGLLREKLAGPYAGVDLGLYAWRGELLRFHPDPLTLVTPERQFPLTGSAEAPSGPQPFGRIQAGPKPPATSPTTNPQDQDPDDAEDPDDDFDDA